MMSRSILVLFLCFLATAASLEAGAASTPLGKSCDFFEDEQGIPHLRAPDELTGYACWGFLQARDRAWQMDFFRRAAQGRRAEILGSELIKSDYLMRLLNLYGVARRVTEQLDPHARAVLEAFASGINQGIEVAIKSGAYEFRELGYEPESWSPVDSIALVLLQSFDQTRRAFYQEMTEEQWQKAHGKETPGLFGPDEVPWDTTILKAGEFPAIAAAKQESHAACERSSVPDFFAAWPELIPRRADGSNNWVVSPKLSRTGHAWFANDPHLNLEYPSIWHWVHVEFPGMDVIGAALPGLPAVVSGANRHAAWGLTNAYLPVADVTYLPESEIASRIEAERPTIWFKWWKFRLPFVFKSLRRLRVGGTVLPILPLEVPPGQALVLTWTGFNADAGSFAALFRLMAAATVQERDELLARIRIPTWNFVFADDRGGIGYRAVGAIPKRAPPKPWGIQLKKFAEFEREGVAQPVLSADEMPHVLNPARGYIATANNRQWPADGRFSVGRAQKTGFRAFRIEELLKLKGKQDFESMSAIQCDVQAVDARFFLPFALERLAEGLPTPLPHEAKAVSALRVWQGEGYPADFECRACGVYRRWTTRMMEGRKLNEEALYRKLRAGTDPDFTRYVAKSFQLALEDLGVPKSGELPKWNQIHFNPFVHLAHGRFFDEKGIPTPGDEESVNPGTSDWKDGLLQQRSGASQRIIVELANPSVVYSIVPGTEKDLESRRLDDPAGPWQRWAHCQYDKRLFPVDWSKAPAGKIELK